MTKIKRVLSCNKSNFTILIGKSARNLSAHGIITDGFDFDAILQFRNFVNCLLQQEWNIFVNSTSSRKSFVPIDQIQPCIATTFKETKRLFFVFFMHPVRFIYATLSTWKAESKTKRNGFILYVR